MSAMRMQMRPQRFSPWLLAALLLAGAAPAWAAPDPAPGSYAVAGTSRAHGRYAGTARLEATADGLVLTVDRGGGTVLHGPLARGRSGWTFDAPLSARGITDALEGRADPDTHLRGTYRVAEAGGLTGTWRILSGRRVLDSGSEALTPATAGTTAEPPPGPGRVRVAVSVDWEGRELEDGNLRAMEAFRAALPDVPLTHFLNAAYFTKPGADPARVAASMRRPLRAGDETGVHVHGWRSLVQAAGVPFRDHPSFWGDRYPLSPSDGDLGHEVEICAYEVPELRAILRQSRTLLTRAGFDVAPSFRAGGWMADARVLEAIRAEGFLIDSSATDPAWHDELAGVPLRARIGEVWPGVTATSAPFVIPTPAGPVLEMPDTGALADYVTAAEMEGHLRTALDRLAHDPAHDVFVHIGFHQETAQRYSTRVAEAIRAVRGPGAPLLVFETLGASAARARARLEATPAAAPGPDPGAPGR